MEFVTKSQCYYSLVYGKYVEFRENLLSLGLYC